MLFPTYVREGLFGLGVLIRKHFSVIYFTFKLMVYLFQQLEWILALEEELGTVTMNDLSKSFVNYSNMSKIYSIAS